ncbi:HdeD family acid-resistance protein [Methylobacterium sp. J-070]|uniref:HdeD family acid-resistance protein n=1 Tax=Methylobacterium sp. J-070 TaxID=2836650 RepID=UPI001FB8909A|nr:HdeD family acid-resistance protein [Methylobacterium sp. J-070]MCJ2049163.1 HdeD family acid-resistance protein [Methylobacterium sp. J-070]
MNHSLAQNWWVIALRGVIAIGFSILALATPVSTLISLILIFAAYMLVDGLFAIVASLRAARHSKRWGALFFGGLVNIVTGVLAAAWPGITALVFVVMTAVWSIVSGGAMLMAAIHLKRDHGRWWLALGGLSSIAFGIILVLAPFAGAVVLTWWIGIYAFVFGVAMLALAFRLREHRNDRPTPGMAQPAQGAI